MPQSSHLIPASQDVNIVIILTSADILYRDAERPQLLAETQLPCKQPLKSML